MQGPNRYAYVGGNPETLTDPSGHSIACTVIGDPVCTGFGLSASETAPAASSGASEAALNVVGWLLDAAAGISFGAVVIMAGVGALAGVLFEVMTSPEPLITAGSMSTPML